MKRTTSVTNTYVVDIDVVYSSTSHFEHDAEDQTVLEYEDDIVSNAVFIYNMDASFGDEFRVELVVVDNDLEEIEIVTAREFASHPEQPPSGYDVLARVKVTIRAATLRL